LLDQYNPDKFLALYRKADDINLHGSFNEVYGKPLADLEREWLHYIDTLSFHPLALQAAADQAEVMFNYGEMKKYRAEQLRLTGTRVDSVYVMSELGRANFFSGDYKNAAKLQSQMIAMDTPRCAEQMTLGAYQLMLGENDSAQANMERAQQLDTTDLYVKFNRALVASVRGDMVKAKEILSEIVLKANDGPAAAESRILLANMLNKSKTGIDQLKAKQYYADAIKQLAQSATGSAINPTSLMWSGIAFLGQGDTGTAQDYLSTALFLEGRPFYQGMTNLWLGKVADSRRERDVAIQYYRTVLQMSAAAYHQAEARELLVRPYQQ